MSGRLKYREDIVDGLEHAPAALIGLFEGRNFGKLMVRVSKDPDARPEAVRIRTSRSHVRAADYPEPIAVKWLRRMDAARNVPRGTVTRMDTLLKDLTYAVRGLRKNLGFSAVAAITIALGIGACTSIFSVVNAVLLRPLPYSDAQRLVTVWGELRNRNVHDWPFSPPDYRDLRQQSTELFEDMAGFIPAGRAPISDTGGEPEQIRVGGATPNFFRVLGARVQLGRDFIDDDATPQPQPPNQGQAAPGAAAPPRLPAIAIISHWLWMRRYGGDPKVIGKDVDLGGGRAHIVGVLAPDFEVLFPPRANVERLTDMWTAARFNFETANRNNVAFRVVGRLKPGVTVQQAQTLVDRVAADLRKQFPIKQTSGLYFHAVPMFEDLVGDVRPAILSLMGAVAFVLLIACANVANLLVVRAVGAQPRAGRARGHRRRTGAAGAADAGREPRRSPRWARSAAWRWRAPACRCCWRSARRICRGSTRSRSIRRVLTFAVFAGLATALLCGIVPALRASRADVMDVLRSVGGRSAGLAAAGAASCGVVVTEVALSFILLVGAGLMLRSFVALGRIDPGYDPNHVLDVRLPAPQARQPAQRAAFMQQVRDAAAARFRA